LNPSEPYTPKSKEILEQILSEVQQVYDRLAEEIKALNPSCRACGTCCNFDQYGHRLYITTPEMLYFLHHLPLDFRIMTDGICPYQENARCGVYAFRFAACRIFFCTADTRRQHQLSEEAVARFKEICRRYDFPYRYLDLKYALSRPELWLA
jgi:Fe-S-cluster containining protein